MENNRYQRSILCDMLFCQGLWWSYFLLKLMCYGELQILYSRNSRKLFLNVRGTSVFICISTFVNSLEIPISLYFICICICAYGHLILNVMFY